MSFSGFFSTLANAFSQGWIDETTLGPLTPIAWPNVAFTKPIGKPWVRFNVIDGASAYMSAGSAGSNLVRHVGQVVIQIFVPSMTAETKMRDLADVAVDIFHGARFDSGNIRFGTGYVSASGSSLEDGWHQLNVIIPFQRDELK